VLGVAIVFSFGENQKKESAVSTKILRINTAGYPMEWIGWQEAVVLHARDLVSWTYGESVKDVFGGYSKSGQRSVISLTSVLASRGKVVNVDVKPSLSNATLFRRDQHTCLYCGMQFSPQDLSRDHVEPVSRGGRDDWTNVVTACKRCNTRKGSRLLSECDMELLALPYRPNHAEYLALTHSGRILGDQMAILRRQFSSGSRLFNQFSEDGERLSLAS
jgi:hypothetical protein